MGTVIATPPRLLPAPLSALLSALSPPTPFLLPALLSLLLLAGCSGTGGGANSADGGDYRHARVEPELKLPPHLNGDSMQDIYVIPPVAEGVAVAGEFEVPRPTPLIAKDTEDTVRIQKLGDEQWMLVSVAPGQLWPQVRAYLTANGMQVGRVDARAGIIETNWLTPQEEGAPEERYRFLIEQGVQRNTAELHVLQMTQGDEWPPASSDLEREAQMLREVAQYVANRPEETPVSMMAQQELSASGKVGLREAGDGTPYVWLELPYHRAWASVDRALRDSGFEIRDRNRSAGLYYIRYAEGNREGGLFGWLLDEDDENLEAMADSDLVLHLETVEGDALAGESAGTVGGDIEGAGAAGDGSGSEGTTAIEDETAAGGGSGDAEPTGGVVEDAVVGTTGGAVEDMAEVGSQAGTEVETDAVTDAAAENAAANPPAPQARPRNAVRITLSREDEVTVEVAQAQSVLTLIKGNIN